MNHTVRNFYLRFFSLYMPFRRNVNCTEQLKLQLDKCCFPVHESLPVHVLVLLGILVLLVLKLISCFVMFVCGKVKIKILSFYRLFYNLIYSIFILNCNSSLLYILFHFMLVVVSNRNFIFKISAFVYDGIGGNIMCILEEVVCNIFLCPINWNKPTLGTIGCIRLQK